MKKMKEKAHRGGVLAALLLPAVLFLAGSVALGADETVERSFEVGPGGRLTLRADVGSIRVETGAVNRVDVRVRVRAPNPEDLKLDFRSEGNDVFVEADYDRSLVSFWRRVRVEFDIQVPRQYNVDLKTSGGSISVADLVGEARAQTSGGGLNFGRIDGPVYGRTSGGSIELSACSGDAEVHTSGGGIRIGETQGRVVAKTSGGSISISRSGGDVEAKTSGGNIRVDEVFGAIDASTSGGSIVARISEQPSRDCRLSTSGGSVTVHLASQVAVDLDAKASGGRVDTDIPFQVSGRLSKSEVKASIGGGGPSLKLRTSGGSIRIRSLDQ